MILKINGRLLEPESGGGIMDKINEFADFFVEKEVELIIAPVLEFLRGAAVYTIHGLTEIMPELAVLIAMVCVTIGMFGNFGKWLLRAACVYLGGAVWITLATAS